MVALSGLFSLLLSFHSCSSSNEEEREVSSASTINDSLSKFNIIILLDLSDRVLVQNQISRDMAIIKHLYENFKSIAGESSKMFFNSKDRIKVKILEQQNVPYSSKILAWEDTMDIDMSQILFEQQSAPDRRKRDEAFNRTVNNVYSNCILKNKSAYLGANIQKYFKQDLLKDLDATSKNKIFILTDGYPVVEGKSARVKDLENLENKFSAFQENTDVYFLEINPRDDPNDNEYPRLISDWSKWLSQAGFKLEDETYFQNNQTNFNSVAERINNYLGLANIETGPENSENIVSIENCQGKLAALLNDETLIDGKSIDALISEAVGNCNAKEVKIDNGYLVQSLKTFLLINFSSKNKYKYKITEAKMENGTLICKIISI
jgi:hypothetical protein